MTVRFKIKDQLRLVHVKKKGRKDGRNWRWRFFPFIKRNKHLIPNEPDNSELIQTERKILKACETDLNLIDSSWHSRDIKLFGNYTSIFEKLIKAEWALDKEQGEVSEPAEKYKQALIEVEKVNHPPRWSGRVAHTIIILIGLVEFPLNSIVFQVFGEDQLSTYIFAGIIALGVPFGTHAFGQGLRQDKKNLKDIIWVILVPLLFAATMWGVSFVRAKVMGATQSLLPSSERLSEQESLYIFYIINILLFAISSYVSYLGSRTNLDEYVEKQDVLEKAERKYKKEDAEAVMALKNQNKIKIEWQKIKLTRKRIHNKYLAEAKYHIQRAEYFIETYRERNLEARSECGVSACKFIDIPKLEIPRSLNKIRWEMNVAEQRYKPYYERILEQILKEEEPD